ncbi:MAG: protein kinase [Planctomycetota bacterium]
MSDAGSGEERLLDEVFERAVADLQDGREPDVAELIAGHEHLASQVAGLVETARAACGRARRPADGGGLGSYRLLGELGRGGMAVVYRARQAGLERDVALKVFGPQGHVGDGERRRFLNEARALARLAHPHVVAVYDIHDDPLRPAYAMEWIRGGTLAQLVRRRTEARTALEQGAAAAGGDDRALVPRQVWVPWVVSVGATIARALATVHEAGLLHRDVKPSNILLRSDGTPLLSDFGLVRDPSASLHTRAGAFLGTVAFAPPEQLRGEELDARADVYSLGATLYQALALRLPLEGAGSIPAMLRRIEAGRIPPLRAHDARLPVDLQTVIAKALEPERGARYADAEALADDLERVLRLQPVLARRSGWLRRTARAARRNRRVVVAATAGALAAGLVAGLTVLARVERARNAASAAAEVLAAHAALLDTRLEVRAALGPRGDNPVLRERLAGGAERALVRYDAALAVGSDLSAARGEREVVAKALTWLRAPGERAWPTTPATLEGRGGAELRELGLLAYLTGELDAAVRAWQPLEALGAADPLVLGLLGQVYLAEQRPALAYPRLKVAADAFADVPSLAASTAHAAILCGDLESGRAYLERARSGEEVLPILARARADLTWLEGEADDAAAQYNALADLFGFQRLAEMDEARGALEDALGGWTVLVSMEPDEPGHRRALLRCARRWWNGLEPDGRRAWLHEAFEGRTQRFGTALGLLYYVVRAREELAAAPAPRLPAFHAEARDGAFDAEVTSGATAPGSIDALAERMRVACIDHGRCADLPEELRARLVELWLDPAGGDEAWALLERADAVLPAGDSPYDSAAEPIPAPFVERSAFADFDVTFASLLTEYSADVGDLDGDGRPELLLGAGAAAGDPPRAGRVLAVRAEDGVPLWSTRGAAHDELGSAVAAVGDVDGDGICDWAAGALQQELSLPGYVRIGSGADGGELARLRGEVDGELFGVAVLGLGDVDADGVLDLAVGAPRAGDGAPGPGAVRVLGVDGRTLYRVTADAGDTWFGCALAGLGDVDGDGACDFAVTSRPGADSSAAVRACSGRDGSTLWAVGPPAIWFGPGVSLGSGADVDGDGIADLAIGYGWLDPGDGEQIGGCLVVSGRDGRELLRLRGAPRADGFGIDAAPIGDVDGDGLSEIAVSALATRAPRKPRVRVFSSRGGELAELAELVGWSRMRSVGAGWVALRIGAWSRYGERPLGGPARAVFLK